MTLTTDVISPSRGPQRAGLWHRGWAPNPLDLDGTCTAIHGVEGLSVVGREHYGVFPLRGKLRTVRDLTVKQLLENSHGLRPIRRAPFGCARTFILNRISNVSTMHDITIMSS